VPSHPLDFAVANEERDMRALLGAVISLGLLALSPSSLLAQAQGHWTGTGAMQTPRELNAQAALAGGKVLAVGGVDNSSNILATAEIYDPASGAWTYTGAMAAAREQFAAVVLKGGKILVIGGLGTGGVVLGAAEVYDPTTASWSPAGTLNVARFGHTATLLENGKVLVAGGCTANPCSATASSELYDPTTNGWTTTGSLGTARYAHAAVLLGNGKVLAIGGQAGGASSSCELYSVVKGKWSPAANTHDPRYLSGTTLLPDGDVLVTGGVITRYPIGTAELYNPTTNLWAYTGGLATARYAHSSTLLGDGTVLLAGGYGQSISCGKACTSYIPTAAVEIYNPTTGAFSATTSLNRALAYQSTTLTTTGRALASGGLGYGAYCCLVVSDAEYFEPLTLSFSSYALNFGVLQIGLTSPSQTVTVTNLSDHASVFSSIGASGDYAQTNNCPTTLDAGQQCAIMVTFTPTKAGARNGTLTVKDNDPGSPTQTIALSGTGEILSLGLTPASLNLGTVTVGSTSSQTATLTNDGSAPVGINSITVLPTRPVFTQSNNNCPASLAVQQACTITVVFKPPDIFTYKATVEIANSAGAAALLPVTGQGADGPSRRP
jgi:N-acetylneuraminic acid mutarotase